MNSPFSVIYANLSNIFSNGTFTFLNIKKPLSIPFKPFLGPQSPITIPFLTLWSFLSRISTKNACTPYYFPSIYNYANTTVIFAKLAVAPIQNLVAISFGVLIIKHFWSLSYIAVVCTYLTFDPCPNSVKLKLPISINSYAFSKYLLCLSVPKFNMVFVYNEKWTPNFTHTAGS